MSTDAVKRFVEAANDLVAEGLAKAQRDNPPAFAEAIAFQESGAFARLIVDSHADRTTVDFVLWKDETPMRIFKFDLKRVDPKRH